MNFLKNFLGNNELLPLDYVCYVKCTCDCGDSLDQVLNNEPGTHPDKHTVHGTKKP